MPLDPNARLQAIACLLGPMGPAGPSPEMVHKAAAVVEDLEAWAVHGDLPALPEPPTAAATPAALAASPPPPPPTTTARNPHSVSLEAPLSPWGVSTLPHPVPHGAPSVGADVTAGTGIPIANTAGTAHASPKK